MVLNFAILFLHFSTFWVSYHKENWDQSVRVGRKRKITWLMHREINLTVSSSLCLMQLFTVEFSTILPCYIITLLGFAFANASKFAFRDHSYITSEKGLGGWGQKNGNFCWRSVLFMMTHNIIYADVGWVGQKKFKNVLT